MRKVFIKNATGTAGRRTWRQAYRKMTGQLPSARTPTCRTGRYIRTRTGILDSDTGRQQPVPGRVPATVVPGLRRRRRRIFGLPTKTADQRPRPTRRSPTKRLRMKPAQNVRHNYYTIDHFQTIKLYIYIYISNIYRIVFPKRTQKIINILPEIQRSS